MECVPILGVYFDNILPDEALAVIIDHVERGEGGYVVTPNPEFVYACCSDPELTALLNGAALSVVDGIGIIYAARILKTPLKGRVPGIDLAKALMGWMAEHGRSLYILGGKPDVARRAAENLAAQYPGLVIAGYADGYYTDEMAAAKAIRETAPDVVFVCMGFPRQERFMAKYPELGVMLGIGGSVDVFAGDLKLPPVFFRKLGLEWLFRLIAQPSRIKRMIKLPVFLWLAVRERFRREDR